jgi:hypothetical protein
MEYIINFDDFLTEASMNTEEFKKIAKQKYNNLYDYSNTKFVDFKTPVRIICKKHGRPFNILPMEHLKGVGCAECKQERIKPLEEEGYDVLTKNRPNSFYEPSKKYIKSAIRRN